MSHSPTITRQTLPAQIVQQLGLRILQGEFAPDQTLPNEALLCAQLGVSRPVLREAIKVLAAKGLLTIRTKTGTRVCPRDQWHLLDPDLLAWQGQMQPNTPFIQQLRDVRLVLEPAAARFAAERASTVEIATLEAWLTQMHASVTDVEAFISADLGFHHAILLAAHNELLQQMSQAITTALRTSRRLTTRLAGASEAALPLHAAVFAAIRGHDAEAAAAAMHIVVTQAADDAARSLASWEDQ